MDGEKSVLGQKDKDQWRVSKMFLVRRIRTSGWWLESSWSVDKDQWRVSRVLLASG